MLIACATTLAHSHSERNEVRNLTVAQIKIPSQAFFTSWLEVQILPTLKNALFLGMHNICSSVYTMCVRRNTQCVFVGIYNVCS